MFFYLQVYHTNKYLNQFDNYNIVLEYLTTREMGGKCISPIKNMYMVYVHVIFLFWYYLYKIFIHLGFIQKVKWECVFSNSTFCIEMSLHRFTIFFVTIVICHKKFLYSSFYLKRYIYCSYHFSFQDA